MWTSWGQLGLGPFHRWLGKYNRRRSLRQTLATRVTGRHAEPRKWILSKERSSLPTENCCRAFVLWYYVYNINKHMGISRKTERQPCYIFPSKLRTAQACSDSKLTGDRWKPGRWEGTREREGPLSHKEIWLASLCSLPIVIKKKVAYSQTRFHVDSHLFLKAMEKGQGWYQMGLWWTGTCFHLQGQCNLNTT